MTATEVAMPNKTIYVSDDDLPLYQRAQQLAGGNLSSAIAQALRRFVVAEEVREQGLQEITVWVGQGRSAKRNRFHGRVLASWTHHTGEHAEVFTVYLTAKQRYALHVQRGGSQPSWGDWPTISWNQMTAARSALLHRMTGQPGRPTPPPPPVPPAPPAPPMPPAPPAPPAWFGYAYPPQSTPPEWGPQSKATFEVFDSIDAMREHIPPELADMLDRPVEPEIEDLDI